ncbi:hypothetical protein VTJ49DRAFT_5458 [Mycothermus thermophilus]|uniref:Uncharacterized protein n=1 Tax=Humicola insolens TaxID=85995 RepID=A0ABR3V467_HUMIN
MEAEVFSDDSPSYSSDQDTVVEGGGDFVDSYRTALIDRIMKSFCASLDSKLALAKASGRSPKVDEGKKEEGQVSTVEDSRYYDEEEAEDEEEHAEAQVGPAPSTIQKDLKKAAQVEMTITSTKREMKKKRFGSFPMSILEKGKFRLAKSERAPREAEGMVPGSGLPPPAPAPAPAEASSPPALRLHIQQDPPCRIQEKRTLQEGFTKDQEKKLRSRKKTHADMNDEDKWREIYTILFPDDDHSSIPSPYYDDSDDEEASGFIGSGEFEDYATFVRREMPTLVRRELEVLFRDEFKDVEERLRPRIAQMVLDLQPKLLDLYKQSQMPLSEYGPQQHEDRALESEPAVTPLLLKRLHCQFGSKMSTSFTYAPPPGVASRMPSA